MPAPRDSSIDLATAAPARGLRVADVRDGVPWVVAGLGIIVFVVRLVAVAASTPARLVAVLPDDLFYYIVIGEQFNERGFATFDGTRPTNGFHPLWQLISILVTRAFGPGHWGSARTLVVIEALLGLAAVAVLAWMLRRLGRPMLAASFFTLGLLVMSSSANGMEAGASVLMLSLIALCLAQLLRAPSVAGFLVYGLLVLALGLSRLDYFLVAPLLWLAPFARRSAWSRQYLLAAAAGPASVALFWTWFYVHYDNVLSTSALVKQRLVEQMFDGWGGRLSMESMRSYQSIVDDYAYVVWKSISPDAQAVIDPQSPFTLAVVLGLVVLASGAVVRLIRLPRRVPSPSALRAAIDETAVRRPDAVALSVIAAVVMLKLAVDLYASPFWSFLWYSLPVKCVVAGVIALGFSQLIRMFRDSGPATLMTILVAAAITVPALGNLQRVLSGADVVRDTNPWPVAILNSESALGELPDDSTVAVADGGLVGFLASDTLTVVNVDGLVSDYEGASTFWRLTSRERSEAVGADFFYGLMNASERELFADCDLSSSYVSPPVFPGHEIIIVDMSTCGR